MKHMCGLHTGGTWTLLAECKYKPFSHQSNVLKGKFLLKYIVPVVCVGIMSDLWKFRILKAIFYDNPIVKCILLSPVALLSTVIDAQKLQCTGHPLKTGNQ